MKKQSLFFLSVLFIAFQSCKKSDKIFTPEKDHALSTSEVKAENGMLVFTNHDHFKAKMAEWNGMDGAELSKVLESFDYVSYYSDTTIDKEFEITPDHLLQKVINNRGAVKVNDSLFVLTPYNDIVIKGGDLETYNKVLAGNSSGADVEVFPVINGLKSEQTIELLAGPAPSTWYGEQHYYSPEERISDRPERVRITIFAQTRLLYPSCGVSFRGEAYRRCGLWCVDWREDEVSAMTILPGSTFQTNYFTTVFTVPAGTISNTAQANIFSYPTGGATAPNGDHFGFQDLTLNLSFKKRTNSPTRTITLRVSNGVLLAPIDNW